jgi:hypothetical protein
VRVEIAARAAIEQPNASVASGLSVCSTIDGMSLAERVVAFVDVRTMRPQAIDGVP